eukprot:403354757
MGAKKKKKGGKKKKSTKEKKPEEEKKTIFEIPEYIDPKIYTPQVQLTIKLATPPNDHLTFKITARTTTRIEEIERKIIDQHDGSIKNVTICQSVYTKEQILDPKKRLCDVGITTAGSYVLIYDFQPVSYPLLTTAVPESTFQNVR